MLPVFGRDQGRVLSDRFPRFVTEELTGPGVPRDDGAVGLNGNDRLEGGVHELREKVSLAFGPRE
jgi:hypothetical protein